MQSSSPIREDDDSSKPCFMRGCPFVAQGFDDDSARLKLREHLEAEHQAVVPELQKAGVIQ